MSRLAKKSIALPAGVEIRKENGRLRVKGPKGEKEVVVPGSVTVEIGQGSVLVGVSADDIQSRANVGTTWSLIKNAVHGVSLGFAKTLEIEGVGYRANLEGDTLVLLLGFVNPVRAKIPEGLSVTVEKNAITVSGVDKELVGRFTSYVRSLKKPEPYKGKGIRYRGEVVKRKVGKKAATAAAA